MKQFVVMGSGRFGSTLAKNLCKLGNEVLVIDIDEHRVRLISDEVTQAVVADVTDVEVFSALGLAHFDVAVISMGRDLESSILATLHCKESGIPQIIVKASNHTHEKVLSKIGADKVILPEQEMGKRMAYNLSTSNVLEYFELSRDISIAEVDVPESWYDQTILQVDTRGRFGLNIIGIKKNNAMNGNPRPNDVLKKGDVLVVVGTPQNINNLESVK